MRWFLRSKIHNATVIEANINYQGSITIDEKLLEESGLLPTEKVLVVSLSTGTRLETYVIPGEYGAGMICINGAAAHLIHEGERIIIMGFELSESPVPTKCILVENNKFVRNIVQQSSEHANDTG